MIPSKFRNCPFWKSTQETNWANILKNVCIQKLFGAAAGDGGGEEDTLMFLKYFAPKIYRMFSVDIFSFTCGCKQNLQSNALKKY